MEKELILAGVLSPDPPLGSKTEPGLSLVSHRKYDTQTLWCSYNAFVSLIAGREDLTMDSVPMIGCMGKTCLAGSSENMLTKIECLPCAQNSPTSRLNHCSRCEKPRCDDCFRDAVNSLTARSSFQDAMMKTIIWCDGKGGSRSFFLRSDISRQSRLLCEMQRM